MIDTSDSSLKITPHRSDAYFYFGSRIDPKVTSQRFPKSIVNYRVVEQAAHCPFCGESISLLVDLSAGAQSYIEDCQVCCQPMQITTELDADEEIHLRVDCA